jgi:hypothetical protein
MGLDEVRNRKRIKFKNGMMQRGRKKLIRDIIQLYIVKKPRNNTANKPKLSSQFFYKCFKIVWERG